MNPSFPSFLFNPLYMPNTRIQSVFNSNNQNQDNNIPTPAPHKKSTKSPKKSLSAATNKVSRALGLLPLSLRKMDLVFESCLAQDTDFPICESPVWVFGKSYSVHYDLDELRRTVASCLWCTYRKNFSAIAETGLTSDRGWGCMIRAGQMLMAKVLMMRYLGSSWHWDPSTRSPPYLQLVSLFSDTPAAPLSIHSIASHGVSLGKPIGSWLGPNTIAQALKKTLTSVGNLDVEIVICMDSCLVVEEVKNICLKGKSLHPQDSNPSTLQISYLNRPRPSPPWTPLMLVIPLRLGLSDLNPAYIPAFRAVFEMEQNVGIIGGRPNHALYFIGYADSELLFLDPHTVQSAAPIGLKIYESEKEADISYHSSKPGRMGFGSMDPSIAVCFYCEDEKSFEGLVKKLGERFAGIGGHLGLFEICERRPDLSDMSNLLETNSKSSASSSSSCCSNLLSTTKKSNQSTHTNHLIRKSRDMRVLSDFEDEEHGEDDEFEILG